MKILVHNAVMVEELPAGVCSIFTISHVVTKDPWDSVGGGGKTCQHKFIYTFPS